jgi:membrane protein implicated in regulation of membrane protease activity
VSLDRLPGAALRLTDVRAWILYSALRLGLFAVLFGILYALTVSTFPATAWAVAGIGAAILALCVSYIFLKPLRDRVALELVNARAGTGKVAAVKVGSDEDIEDGARGEK